MNNRLLSVIAALAIPAMPISASACGADSNCVVGERFYRAYVPTKSTETQRAALVFAHGFRGSAEGTMKNQSFRRWADQNDVVLIAVKSAGLDWDIPFAPRTYESDGRKEEAYFEAVLADAEKRFDIDRTQVVMSGFSAGGMVTWHMACHRPDLFAGFVPMAGTFWLTPPDTCEDPLKPLVHIHGDADGVVPFEGRQIRNTHQGSIFEALALYRAKGGFTGAFAEVSDDLSCSIEANSSAAILAFCQFPGGHDFKIKHLDYGWAKLTE